MAHGGGGTIQEDEGETPAGEQAARFIERAIARGFDALDVDGRIERALDRRESAGASRPGEAGGTGLALGVIPERGALYGISVASGSDHGGDGSMGTVVAERSGEARMAAGGAGTIPLVLGLEDTQPGEGAHDLVVVGPTALPIPQKLCDRIWGNQFVSMQELLPARLGASDPSWKDLIEAASKVKATNQGKVIKSIEQWVTCFNSYMIVMAMKHPERLPDLLAYSSKIVEASRCYEGTPWLAYDVHFRKQAAAKKATKIAETDTSIWTWYFSRASPRAVCRDCLEPGHVSCVDGEEEQVGGATGGGKWRAGAHSRAGARPGPYQGARICRLHNSVAGCRYTDCRFEHRCGACREKGHTERNCPRGQQWGMQQANAERGGFQHGGGQQGGSQQGGSQQGGGQQGGGQQGGGQLGGVQQGGGGWRGGSQQGRGQPFRQGEGVPWQRH